MAITPALPSPVSPSTSTLRYGAQKLNALNVHYVSVSLQITKIDAALEAKKCEQAEILSKIKGMELSKANLLSDQSHIMCQTLTMSSPTPSPMKSPMKVSPQKTVTKFFLPSPVKATPSTSEHGEKGGILMIYLMMMNWTVLCQKYQKLGRKKVATLKGKIRRGE